MSRVVFFGLLLSLHATQLVADEAQSNIPAIQRETRVVLGWNLHINTELLTREPKATKLAITLLKKQLAEIVRDVPEPAVVELKKVPLYFSPSYPGDPTGAAFHPSAQWLREHGRDPVMERSIEFTNIPIFEAETKRMPNFALHELAHAYHNIVLKDGFNNATVIAAYDRAKQSKSYDRVEQFTGVRGKSNFMMAYAMTNQMEYFAESSEAYFSKNDFFPFNRSQLKTHDPEMVEVLIELWGVKDSSKKE